MPKSHSEKAAITKAAAEVRDKTDSPTDSPVDSSASHTASGESTGFWMFDGASKSEAFSFWKDEVGALKGLTGAKESHSAVLPDATDFWSASPSPLHENQPQWWSNEKILFEEIEKTPLSPCQQFDPSRDMDVEEMHRLLKFIYSI